MQPVSFESLFDLAKLVKEKYVVLVRNSVIYGWWSCHFAPIVAMDREGKTTIREGNILPTDILYAFNKPEDIYLTLRSGNCLDKFLVKKGESCRFDKLAELLKDGYLVGAIYNTSARKHNKKARVLKKDEDFSVFDKDGDKLDSFLRHLGDSSSLYSSEIFITKNEFEFWKWLNT